MNRLSNVSVARFAAILAIATVLLVSGCTATKTPDNAAAKPTQQTGITEAQLVALRSTPASDPITGVKVPEIITLADLQALTGTKELKFEGQT